MKTLKFKSTIKCGGCVATVTPQLDSIKDIKWEVDLNHPDRILTVSGDNVTPSEVQEKLKKVGYQAEPI